MDAGDDVQGDYGAQRPIETEYKFVEFEPSVISLLDKPTGRANIELDCLDGQDLLPK